VYLLQCCRLGSVQTGLTAQRQQGAAVSPVRKAVLLRSPYGSGGAVDCSGTSGTRGVACSFPMIFAGLSGSDLLDAETDIVTGAKKLAGRASPNDC